MGFCNRCGEILTTGKCRKCGGRSVASTAASLIDTVSVADKWKSQYADSILGSDAAKFTCTPQAERAANPFGKRPPLCLECNKAMVTPEDQNNNNKICNACQPRGICPECHRAVVGRDAYVEHGTRFWHKDCFRCRTCAAFIGDTPVVDLQGSPCCESCMMAQAPPTPISPTSTLSSLGDMPDSLPSSLSSLPWLSKRQQQQHPLRSRPRLDSSLFQKETTLPHQDVSPLSNPSPVLGLSRSYSPVSPRPAGHTPTATKSTQQFSDELCRACAKPVARPCVRLGTFWYHHECLRCDACQGYFNDSEVVHDGQHMYHPKCRRPSPPSGFKCDECKKPITQHLVKHSGRVVHPECFRCFGCHNTLSCNQPYVEIDKQAYCQPCSLQEQQCTPAPAPPVMESNMFTHRSRRAPPKLGGPKICPRCRLSISFMDEIPGPRASRWHKKCLRCQGCQKQMDSGAKVTETKETGSWVVYCTDCSVGRQARFVR